MSVRDMDLLIRTELSDDRSVENGYRAFLESLDGALSSTVQEMGAYEGTDNLADAAVHFGLLSYAAGLVSRQYVAQLAPGRNPPANRIKPRPKKAAKSKKGAQGLMRDYVILTDSCCDLSAEMAAELGVEVLPLSLQMGIAPTATIWMAGKSASMSSTSGSAPVNWPPPPPSTWGNLRKRCGRS